RKTRGAEQGDARAAVPVVQSAGNQVQSCGHFAGLRTVQMTQLIGGGLRQMPQMRMTAPATRSRLISRNAYGYARSGVPREQLKIVHIQEFRGDVDSGSHIGSPHTPALVQCKGRSHARILAARGKAHVQGWRLDRGGSILRRPVMGSRHYKKTGGSETDPFHSGQGFVQVLL